MKIKVTKTHTVKYSVESFTATEGGMDHDSYGVEVDDIAQAIELLEQAQTKQKMDKQKNKHAAYYDWKIVCHVQTSVSGDELS